MLIQANVQSMLSHTASSSRHKPAVSNHDQHETYCPSQHIRDLPFHVFLFLEALLLSHRGVHRGGSSIVAYSQSLHIDAPLFERLGHVDLTATHTNAPSQAARLCHNFVSASCNMAMNSPYVNGYCPDVMSLLEVAHKEDR